MNVNLEEDIPALDEKKKLTELQATTLRILKTSECRSMIENIAHRLIASSFYFLKNDRIDFDETSKLWICTGMRLELRHY